MPGFNDLIREVLFVLDALHDRSTLLAWRRICADSHGLASTDGLVSPVGAHKRVQLLNWNRGTDSMHLACRHTIGKAACNCLDELLSGIVLELCRLRHHPSGSAFLGRL